MTHPKMLHSGMLQPYSEDFTKVLKFTRIELSSLSHWTNY
jgi:hypothetical protein